MSRQPPINERLISQRTNTDGARKTSIKTDKPRIPRQPIWLGCYVRTNLQCPQPDQITCAQGNVIVEFVVDTDGTTGDFVILSGIDLACNQEAIRLVEAMPAWTPGTLAGEPVRVKLVLPIRFA